MATAVTPNPSSPTAAIFIPKRKGSISQPTSPKSGGEQERAVTKIFRDIATKYNLTLTMLSKNWSVTFYSPETGKQAGVFGFRFDINGAAAQGKCDDKVATYETLKRASVPAIEHRMFFRDTNEDLVGPEGSMKDICDYAKQFGYNVVCKPVNDSGGRGVSHVKNAYELNTVVRTLFAASPHLCISPFASFRFEYRIIMLDGTPQLAYKKIKPHLVGDGSSTLFDLYVEWGRTHKAQFKKIDQSTIPMGDVLKKGDIYELAWKHNLCNGATAELLPLPNRNVIALQPNSNEAKLSKIVAIAIKAVRALGIRFCSVDIAEISPVDFKVLEVNSGVMMEHLIKQYPYIQKKVRSIYEKVICQMVGLDPQSSEEGDEEIDVPYESSASSMADSPNMAPETLLEQQESPRVLRLHIPEEKKVASPD